MSNPALPYNAGWQTNGLTWSNHENFPLRFAISSFCHQYRNYIDIVQKRGEELVCRATWTHCYPPTKILFAPSTCATDIMVSTADYLRVWSISEAPEGAGLRESEFDENKEADEIEAEEAQKLVKKKRPTINSSVKLKTVFDMNKPNDFCSPVTSCDWAHWDPSKVACCSIDTTVTMWDINAEKHTVQLIAHDKDVYDVAFSRDHSIFASCGADGAVKLFDLREMEHCTILWESEKLTPLLRVAWNVENTNYLSTFGINDTDVKLIDIRYPSQNSALSNGHSGPINSISWAPHSCHYMCSAGEDKVVNIWNLNWNAEAPPTRYLTYDAPAPVNCVSWSRQHQYVGITTGQQAQFLLI